MQLEDQDGFSAPEVMPASRVERMINVNPTHLDWVRAGMRADVEEEHGTGRKAYIPGMGIAGKTGTAQVWTPKGMDTITWFVSFAPFDDPKYAVVVMIESGVSGGATCVPKTKVIYEAIQKKEQGTLDNFAVR